MEQNCSLQNGEDFHKLQMQHMGKMYFLMNLSFWDNVVPSTNQRPPNKKPSTRQDNSSFELLAREV